MIVGELLIIVGLIILIFTTIYFNIQFFHFGKDKYCTIGAFSFAISLIVIIFCVTIFIITKDWTPLIEWWGSEL